MMRRFTLGAWLSLCAVLSRADILFEQDFSAMSSGSASFYVSPSPNRGQWDGIGSTSGTTVDVANGALRYSRSGRGYGFFARSTDFDPEPPILVYRFDLNASSASQSTSVARWQVGSGFSSSGGKETSGVRAEFGLSFSSGGAYALRNLAQAQDGIAMSGQQSIMWVLNNSLSPYTYLAPNNTSQTVASGHWDLWEGWRCVFDEQALLSGSAPLTDLKFAFDNGSGSIQMDNFRLEAVPEPAATGFISAGFLFGLILLRQLRQRRLHGAAGM